jgi:hypothetical protein
MKDNDSWSDTRREQHDIMKILDVLAEWGYELVVLHLHSWCCQYYNIWTYTNEPILKKCFKYIKLAINWTFSCSCSPSLSPLSSLMMLFSLRFRRLAPSCSCLRSHPSDLASISLISWRHWAKLYCWKMTGCCRYYRPSSLIFILKAGVRLSNDLFFYFLLPATYLVIEFAISKSGPQSFARICIIMLASRCSQLLVHLLCWMCFVDRAY